MSGNYRPTERTTGIGGWSSTLPAGDAGNATHALDGALGIVFECVAATASPAGTVEGKTASGVWTQIRSVQYTSGTYTLRAAGATVTLATADLLYVEGHGYTHIRFKRASGTSMTWTARTSENVENAFRSAGASGGSVTGPIADDGAFTVGTTTVFPFGALADETSPDSVDEGDIGAVRMTLDRNLRTIHPAVQCYSFIPDGTDELLIDATARKLWGVDVFHIDATPVYVKLYDKATAASEADTPAHRTGVSANATSTLGAGSNKGIWPSHVPLTTGLSVRAVTGIADNSDAALTTAEVLVNVYWSI